MARRTIRTKSGRLRALERRRRLSKTSLKAGEVIVLDRSRRAHKGVRQGGTFQVELVANTQFAIDSDIRKLLHQVRLGLAHHYADSLKASRAPTGKKELPDLKDQTLERNPGRPDKFGVLSGEMSTRWLLFKVRGGPLRCSTRIKPYGGEGRSVAINKWLKRGIDLQSLDGESAQVIADLVRKWLLLAAPSSGDGVATPRRVPHNGGELPSFRN